MINKQLRQIWEQLRSQKPSRENFLDEVHIKGIRGIKDLRIAFEYPVSVLAGPNGCGKSTVLFALACAYEVPEAKLKEFKPATLFPDFKAKRAELPQDARVKAELSYAYLHHNERKRMRWVRGKGSWNRSYFGEKRVQQPERKLHFHTLSNLSNPSEVRSILQLGYSDEIHSAELDASLLAFAHRILPFKYKSWHIISRGDNKDLLYVSREDIPSVIPTEVQTEGYSEFHMSAGERMILRLSRDISKIQDALVLIDEVEAGLHPYTQQQLMLELQRLSLRNNLQIVVTSHSPVVLDTVPPEARIFLEREGDNVLRRLPYRDIIQNAFYNRTLDRLSILCEDDIAEGIVTGVFDHLNQELGLRHSDVEISRDTGKDEFSSHIRALARVGVVEKFIFILDGDARALEARLKEAASAFGKSIRLLFLPGTLPPEAWIWSKMSGDPDTYAFRFGISVKDLVLELKRLDQLFESSTDKASNINKEKFRLFSEFLKRHDTEIARIVGFEEKEKTDFYEFYLALKEAVTQWRDLNGTTL